MRRQCTTGHDVRCSGPGTNTPPISRDLGGSSMPPRVSSIHPLHPQPYGLAVLARRRFESTVLADMYRRLAFRRTRRPKSSLFIPEAFHSSRHTPPSVEEWRPI